MDTKNETFGKSLHFRILRYFTHLVPTFFGDPTDIQEKRHAIMSLIHHCPQAVKPFLGYFPQGWSEVFRPCLSVRFWVLKVTPNIGFHPQTNPPKNPTKTGARIFFPWLSWGTKLHPIQTSNVTTIHHDQVNVVFLHSLVVGFLTEGWQPGEGVFLGNFKDF